VNGIGDVAMKCWKRAWWRVDEGIDVENSKNSLGQPGTV